MKDLNFLHKKVVYDEQREEMTVECTNFKKSHHFGINRFWKRPMTRILNFQEIYCERSFLMLNVLTVSRIIDKRKDRYIFAQR